MPIEAAHSEAWPTVLTTEAHPGREEDWKVWEETPACIQHILKYFRLPYSIIRVMSEHGYKTRMDWADRWPSPKEAREKAAATLGFNAWPDNEKERLEMVFMQVVRECQSQNQQLGSSTQGLTQAGMPMMVGSQPMQGLIPTHMDGLSRKQMEDAWVKSTNTKPPSLELQGSDTLVKRIWDDVSTGQFPSIHLKHLVSRVPEEDQRGDIKVTRKTRVDTMGITREYEDEETAIPEKVRDWEKKMSIFRNTLLMIIWCHPTHSHLQIKKEDLDALYDFLDGPSMLGKQTYPRPGLQVIMWAERRAWAHIMIKVHRGVTFKDAITQMLADTLFWINEVHQNPNQNKGKGKGQDKHQRKLGKGAQQKAQHWKGHKGTQKGKKADKKGNGGGKNRDRNSWQQDSWNSGQEGNSGSYNNSYDWAQPRKGKSADKGRGKGRGRGKGY